MRDVTEQVDAPALLPLPEVDQAPPDSSASRGAMNASTPYAAGSGPQVRTITASGRNSDRSVASRVGLSDPEVKAAKKDRTTPATSSWSVVAPGLACTSSTTAPP